MKRAVVPICVIIFIMFIGCYLIIMEYTKQKAVTDISDELTSDEELIPEINNSNTIQGILINIDEEEKTMIFQDINLEKKYELPYDAQLKIYSKYDSIISFEELIYGEIYIIDYSVHQKKLLSLRVSDETWVYTDIVKFSFDEKKRIMYIGDDAYQFTKNLLIFSNDKEADVMDITNMDTLIVRGVDKKILSVIVDKGHGYLRVTNDVYFVGGFIEIGQDIIKPITEDMLIPVSEGKYHIRVTNRGYAGEDDVKITRDRESELDLSKIEIEEVAIGHIQFNIAPEYAQLYVDNEITEFEERIPLEYGVHNIRVECAGYETVSTNIKVGADYANVDIELDEDASSSIDNTTDSSSSSSTSSTNNSNIDNENNYNSSSSTASSINDLIDTVSASSSSTSTSSSSGSSSTNSVVSSEKKIYIEQPEGAELYLDGNYIGIAPASTGKVTGSHVITLSKDGYQTRSYTVNIENDGNDVTYSFSELAQNQ